jgi:hypothetical protein
MKRTHSVTSDPASDTEPPKKPAPSEGRPKPRQDRAAQSIRARWTSWRRSTKAIVVTAAAFVVATVSFLADGISLWKEVVNNDQVATGARASSARRVVPAPTCLTCTTGKTFPQRVGPRSMGARTFRNPLAFGDEGPRVKPRQRVRVVCRYLQADAPPTVQPGWWYLIASPPWSRQYYSPANSYLNGDPFNGPYRAEFDNGVPVC